MEIALGSAFELETQSLALHKRPWSPKARIDVVLDVISKQQGMLVNFMSKLKQ